MKTICEKHRRAPAAGYAQCVGCEIEELQQQISRAQMLSTRMWNWMSNPDNAKDLTGEELSRCFLREFRQAQ